MYRFVYKIWQDGRKVPCERRPDDGVVVGIFPELATEGVIHLKELRKKLYLNHQERKH